MTDEQLLAVRSQLEADDTAHLKKEALGLLDAHIRGRTIFHDLRTS